LILTVYIWKAAKPEIEFSWKIGLRWASMTVPSSISRTQEFFQKHHHISQFYTLNPCYEENEDDKFKKAAYLSQANSFEQHYNLQILFY
jgi:hypothetical protein